MLWLAISKEMCVLAGTAVVVGHAGRGGGDPWERLRLFMSPSESLCSSDSMPATWYSKATQCCYEPQPSLPGLGLPGPHKADNGMHT